MRRRLASYWADAIEPRFFIIRQLPRAGWRLVALLGLTNVVIGLLPIVFVLTTSVLIGRVPDAIQQPPGSSWSPLVMAFLIASGAFFARQLLAPVAASVGAVMKHRVNGVFRDRLIAISLRSSGIGPLEDDDALESLARAAGDLEFGFRTPGDAAVGTLAYLARYTELAGYVVALGVVWSWPAALAVTASVLCFRYGHRGGLRLWGRAWPRQEVFRRVARYFRDLGMLAPAAKELRVFGLTEWAVSRYQEKATAALEPIWAERRRTNVYFFFLYTGLGLVIACTVLAMLSRSAVLNAMTLTEVVLALQVTIAAIALGIYYPEADDQSEFGMQAARALEDFDRKVTELAAAEPSAPIDGRDAAGLPNEELRFQGVHFTYPSATRSVLDGLDLSLRAGQCTAIVGLNGAGKTTLVKLLARLHEPTEGRLLVDGVDVRDYPVDSWRRQIGVIFQDFNRYELSALDNISFGAVQREIDEVEIRNAAARAGILDALDALPRGLDTPLSRQYDDGAELSGGQWQRVAIARALYAVAAGAKVLVLDEPTAALDVRAEAAFFEQFVELTRGVTTLLISHRFSSVRHADRIVVLEHGRVVEDGSHESLLAADGRYADLFNLQAERFRRGLGAEGESMADLEATG